MNFNFNDQPEYSLNTSMGEEVINLYGVRTKFLIAEQINKDDTVFGDYSHLKTDNTKIYDIYMMPENSEDWDQDGYNVNMFGNYNSSNVTLFAAKSEFDNMIALNKIIGNLIVFPNDKVMEISHVDFVVPGINNLFTYKDAKSIYKLTCKPYEFKLVHEIENTDISYDVAGTDHETLDVYFNELIGNELAQNTEAEITPQVSTVDKTQAVNQKVEKPIVDKEEDDVWGQFN